MTRESFQSKVDAADHSMPALTGLRGLCALWVLLYHAWVYVTPQEITFELFGEVFRFHVAVSIGWSGVQILFVLSAFLLTTPFARHHAGLSSPPGVSKYLVRRVARVFPAYHVQLFLLLAIALLFADRWLITLAELPHYLFMLFMPEPMGVGSPARINGVWWTLPIELSFYLLLPLVAWLAKWRYRWLLLGLSLLSMAAWRFYVLDIVQPAQRPLWVAQLPGSMDSFGIGMLGAVIHVHYTQVQETSLRYHRTLLGLLCLTPLVFFGLGHWMAEDYTSYWAVSPIMFLWTPLFNVAVLVLILNCAINQRLLINLFGNRAVFYLGTVSYGLYLWHAPAGKWLLKQPLIADMQSYAFPRMALAMFLISMFAATLSWFLIEKRAITFSRRFK